jgi:hypothetical protein
MSLGLAPGTINHARTGNRLGVDLTRQVNAKRVVNRCLLVVGADYPDIEHILWVVQFEGRIIIDDL